MMFDYSGLPYTLCVIEMLRIQELYFYLHYVINYSIITEKKYNVYQ